MVAGAPVSFVAAVFCLMVVGALLPIRFDGREDHWIFTLGSAAAASIVGLAAVPLIWGAVLVASPLVVLVAVLPRGERRTGFTAGARSTGWVVATASVQTAGTLVVWLLYTKGFGRSFPIAIESGRDFLIAAVLASAAAAAGVVVRLAAVRVMGQPFMRLGFDPFDSVLVPYVLPVISGVPLITATIVLYDPDDPWAALLNLWWAFPIYAASSYDLRRRRIAQELRREALARQRLAAIGEVSARIVHQSRHQVGLMGWSIHRLRGLVGRSSPDDIEAAERELDALVEAKDRLGEMLASELLHERDAPEPSTDLHGVDVGTARAGVGGSASAGALVRGVAEQLRDEATRAGVDLRVEVAPGATTGTVAPQLRDVVFNLVDNAIDAAAGAVRIEVSSTDGDQLVRVVDDGPGLAATDADRAFEPFYTTKADGTGMGLAIADALVADLGGSLTYERRDGRTTFVVRLPSRGPGRHDG